MVNQEDDSVINVIGTHLLIPWSSRENFTEKICGLPGQISGCWRYHRNFVKDSIQPLTKNSIDEPCAWIIFQRSSEHQDSYSDKTKAFYISKDTKIKLEELYLQKEYHYAIFGFSEEIKTKRVQDSIDSSVLFPVYADYKAWVEGEYKAIHSWLSDETNSNEKNFGLSHYFGSDTFTFRKIENLEIKLSLAQLINAYLDHKCEKFRRHSMGRTVGITKCKIEVGLNHGNLNNLFINFSYIDPSTLEIKNLPKLELGELSSAFSPEIKIRDLEEHNFIEYLRPLYAVGSKSESKENGTNFTETLLSHGRRNILPSEAGQSFLHFPPGELAAYLLYWILLRIFACENQQNRDFIAVFNEWRKSVKNNYNNHDQFFKEILEKPVILFTDRNVFSDFALKLNHNNNYLSIYNTPCSFSSILNFFNLGIEKEKNILIPIVAKFLKKEFSSTSKEFPALPMYRELRWRASSLLNSIEIKTDLPEVNQRELLEAIFDSFANATGLTDTAEAQTRLKDNARLCVFPLRQVLTLWPRNNTSYYIFPLWEDVIHDLLRPVIFAHVFVMNNEDNFKNCQQLQDLLLPLGSAAARYHYVELRQNYEKLQAIRNILGSMLHGSVTAVRSVKSFELLSILSYGKPPENINSLKYSLVNKKTGQEDLKCTRELVAVLRSTILGEDTAAGLLSLGEIVLYNQIRRKFTADQDYKLDSLVEEAKIMINPIKGIYADQQPFVSLISQNPQEQWVIPKGYLDYRIIRGFFAEILRNALLHGKQGENKEVFVEWKTLADNSSVISQFKNRIPENLKGGEESGFTARMKELTKSLPGISLNTWQEEEFYIAELSLGPMVCEIRENDFKNIGPRKEVEHGPS